MKVKHSNIILIGMPGSGKSTVGPLLAQSISRDFLDTDLVIQASQKRALQDIVNTDGQAALRLIEEEVLLSLVYYDHVIATGGSAVYSEQGMMHLKADGIVIFLDTDLATLESRIDNFNTRGLAKRADQTFAQLFDERLPLYRKYADIRINCAGLSPEEVCVKIITELESDNT
ncbi:shikimate kinase [Candidatus Electrothrix aarhusensis]|jgi:shikimate kinase|uniref:Shikimate kinase n=1 Tax=Candidatus Electrothrix aarhusensis TaxID=1859131 RepID=A0A3S3QWJ3_9BACT|nr:shikimate kinase [Candidatus Electrothrix aarhusensis]